MLGIFSIGDWVEVEGEDPRLGWRSSVSRGIADQRGLVTAIDIGLAEVLIMSGAFKGRRFHVSTSELKRLSAPDVEKS